MKSGVHHTFLGIRVGSRDANPEPVMPGVPLGPLEVFKTTLIAIRGNRTHS